MNVVNTQHYLFLYWSIAFVPPHPFNCQRTRVKLYFLSTRNNTAQTLFTNIPLFTPFIKALFPFYTRATIRRALPFREYPTFHTCLSARQLFIRAPFFNRVLAEGGPSVPGHNRWPWAALCRYYRARIYGSMTPRPRPIIGSSQHATASGKSFAEFIIIAARAVAYRQALICTGRAACWAGRHQYSVYQVSEYRLGFLHVKTPKRIVQSMLFIQKICVAFP